MLYHIIDFRLFSHSSGSRIECWLKDLSFFTAARHANCLNWLTNSMLVIIVVCCLPLIPNNTTQQQVLLIKMLNVFSWCLNSISHSNSKIFFYFPKCWILVFKSRSANCNLKLHLFCKESFIGIKPDSLVWYCLWLLLLYNDRAATISFKAMKLKIFTVLAFKKKFVDF